MNVSAVIVTRGNVEIQPLLDSLPEEWEKIIWDNRLRTVSRRNGTSASMWNHDIPDLSVYGRYAAIEYASHDLIYVQDDDVIVSDPAEIASKWALLTAPDAVGPYQGIVANMPQEFRHDGYTDSCLVGFGACFHRDLPKRTFARFLSAQAMISPESREWFQRTCDVVFTTLTSRVLVDVPKVDLPYATDETRMYRQRDHVGERTRMLELARMVRDA